MDDTPTSPVEPESVRRRASRLDAYALGVEAFLAAIGLGIAISFQLDGPISNGITAAGFIVLAVLASAATLAEWNRERLAEAASLLAGVLGVIMGLIAGLDGFWAYAPVLMVSAFAVCFGTANRFIVRDESRHRPVA